MLPGSWWCAFASGTCSWICPDSCVGVVISLFVRFEAWASVGNCQFVVSAFPGSLRFVKHAGVSVRRGILTPRIHMQGCPCGGASSDLHAGVSVRRGILTPRIHMQGCPCGGASSDLIAGVSVRRGILTHVFRLAVGDSQGTQGDIAVASLLPWKRGDTGHQSRGYPLLSCAFCCRLRRAVSRFGAFHIFRVRIFATRLRHTLQEAHVSGFMNGTEVVRSCRPLD